MPLSKCAFSIGLVLVCLAKPALAENCDNALTQSDMNRCAYQDWQRADVDLNTTYTWARERAKGMSAAAADALLQAQRAWITYRDAACEAEGFLFEGGSMQPLIVHSCMAHMTRERTQDMRDIYAEF